jgi:adenosine deaminase
MPAFPSLTSPAWSRRPLVDLHRHLEGAVRTSTILDLARREQHPLARLADARSRLVAATPMDGLLPYLDRVDAGAEVFVRPADWSRAACEVVVDAYDEGLAALDLRFSPWFVHSRTGLAPEAVIDAVVEGVARARGQVPLPVGLIGILLRDLGPDSARPQLESILRRSTDFQGLDLAGNEAGYPASLFAPAYHRARDAGLRLTAHAGEAAGPASVWDAVRQLGVERIGHGVRAAEDPALMDHLAEHDITLELSPTSNVQTRAATSFRDHQIRTLMQHAVPVALCTDNPRASAVTLAHEYQVAAGLAGLSAKELDAIAARAVAAAFTPAR